MKVNILNWEVDINARNLSKCRVSKLETLRFINFLLMVFDRAEKATNDLGLLYLPMQYSIIKNDLFHICEENDLYKRC